MKSPELHTSRLLLRQLLPSDAEALYEYRSHPVVARHQLWRPASVGEVQSFIAELRKVEFNQEGTWFQFAVLLGHTDKLVGDVGVHFLGPLNQQAELGFTMNPIHQRRGYAYEAVQGLIGHLFGRLSKHRLFASVDPENLASVGLLRKLRMRQEAHLRQSQYMGGRWVDDVIYAILKKEWEQFGHEAQTLNPKT